MHFRIGCFSFAHSKAGIMSDSDGKMLVILQQVSKSHVLSVQLHYIKFWQTEQIPNEMQTSENRFNMH